MALACQSTLQSPPSRRLVRARLHMIISGSRGVPEASRHLLACMHCVQPADTHACQLTDVCWHAWCLLAAHDIRHEALYWAFHVSAIMHTGQCVMWLFADGCCSVLIKSYPTLLTSAASCGHGLHWHPSVVAIDSYMRKGTSSPLAQSCTSKEQNIIVLGHNFQGVYSWQA